MDGQPHGVAPEEGWQVPFGGTGSFMPLEPMMPIDLTSPFMPGGGQRGGGGEATLLVACCVRRVQEVRYVQALAGEGAVNVHAGGLGGREVCFRESCERGHVDIVREPVVLTGPQAVGVHARDWFGP